MGTFGEAERRILEFMSIGTEFDFQGKRYRILKSGKPTCKDGEPKTDIYILAESVGEEIEIKISYKKENADFLENKISAKRAEQLFGSNWKNAIMKSTEGIKNDFLKRILIYKRAFSRTEAGAITLGWKFEFVNKKSGDLVGEVILDKVQLQSLIKDIYAGVNLSNDKKNAFVCGKIVNNSGIADYLLMDDTVNSPQEVINKMVSIEEYIDSNPKIYFACKALNLRSFTGKYRGEFIGKFIGKFDGHVTGKYYEEIEKNVYRNQAIEVDGGGVFHGIIEGYMQGIADGKFEGDMSKFKLSSRFTKRSPIGTFKPKWDGDRPLAVQVEWSEQNGELTPKLIFDNPLQVKGNKVAERLIGYMRDMNIVSTRDINTTNVGTDRIVFDE